MTMEQAIADTVVTQVYGDHFDHLSDELHRLDLLLKEQILQFRLHTQQQKSNGDNLFYISNEKIDWILQDNSDYTPDSKAIATNRNRLDILEEAISKKVATCQEVGVILTLPRLMEMFGLSVSEMQAIIICLAPELSSKYDTIYAYLQDDITRKKPTIALILDLLCETNADKWRMRALFNSEAKLFRSGILQAIDDPGSPSGSSSLATFVKVDSRIVNFILGNNALDNRLKKYIHPNPPNCSLAQVLVEQTVKKRLYNFVRHHVQCQEQGQKAVISLHGPYGAGKRQLAQALCQELGCPLLCLDMELLTADAIELDNNLRLAFREGLLTRSIIYLDNISEVAAAEQGKHLLKKIVQLISEFGWLVFLAGERDWSSQGCFEQIRFISIHVPVAGVFLREKVWQQIFANETLKVQKNWSTILAHRFTLTPGQINNGARLARIRQQMRSEEEHISLADYFAACRKQSTHNLGELSVKVEPKYSWNDLVLPQDKKALLKEICSQLKHQHQVFSQWGFAQKVNYGKGLSVLFSGPPGTGKTMASQVIANEVQLDLYRIDLSGIVSKYIGETEKNLNKIFQEAQHSNAILFFDEADALFGKRTEVKDAHDRYANIETSYLLQKMEEYEGMVILATNLRSNMDEAFTRRIRFIVEFPFPDVDLRTLIWKSHFPNEAPLAGEIDYAYLAKRFQLAGGNIKNIVLNSAFLAAEKNETITQEHILHGVKREFEKIGKLWTEDNGYPTTKVQT